MINQQLLDYVRQQLGAGVLRENIFQMAAQGGWQTQEVQEAFAAIDKPTPPPLCSYCHQAVLPTYYFCPNCGNKLVSAPLSTSIETQAWIYAFSAILPLICYIMISKWPGIKYYKSKDAQTKQIGTVAIIILTLSTIITMWLAYVGTQALIKSQLNSISADMSAQGP
ncbi:MAG TPA: hypothetical protein VIJ88_02860 [Candidatus Paceibacterota bacterium]